MYRTLIIPAATALLWCSTAPSLAQDTETTPPMTFFVTSVGLEDGANLGGLAGADEHCQALAAAVGSGDHNWRAYLSNSDPAVDARDRIGNGPWHNADGTLIARDLAHLHGDTLELARVGNLINKMTAVTEEGEGVNSVGDEGPLHHDILTGSTVEGRRFTDGEDHTCSDWRSNDEGSAQVGHHDRTSPRNISWVSAHGSRGCSQEDLEATGGGGLFYCFAID